MLSITVDTLVDEADGSIVDGDISLRDAIAAAPVGELIDFSVNGTINLSQLGELTINKSVTIDGPGANLLTIKAYDPSSTIGDGGRVFNVDDGTSGLVDVEVVGLTLTGGDIGVTDGGGAILSSEHLTVTNSVISGNSAIGRGGGIYVRTGRITVASSTISGNFAGVGGGISIQDGSVTITDTMLGNGFADAGGALFIDVGSVVVTGSTISNNSATYGGGIYNTSGILTIVGSTISDNVAYNGGGGIESFGGNVTVNGSSIVDNTSDRNGGGISSGGNLTINGSTISGNTASFAGGGVWSNNNLTVNNSTISGNSADFGGGIYQALAASTLNNTIVANSVSGGDIFNGFFGTVDGSYNSIEDGSGGPGLVNTISGDPLLGPLADNGGPTLTHALLPGSPAIDAGDPSAVAGVGDVPLYDQRGNPFTRVHGGRIDIGAFEFQSVEPVLPGDYDRDHDVDDADYLLWKQQFGSMVAAYAGSDGNGNGVVDAADYTVWRDNFGSIAPSSDSASLAAVEQATAPITAVDEIAAAPLLLVPVTTRPVRVLSRPITHRTPEHRFVESVDRAFELLLSQRSLRPRTTERTVTNASDSDFTSKAPEEVFRRLGDEEVSVHQLRPLLHSVQNIL